MPLFAKLLWPRGFRAGGSLAVASSTPATPLLSTAKMLTLNHAAFRQAVVAVIAAAMAVAHGIRSLAWIQGPAVYAIARPGYARS
jgi:hypothetical protein